MVYEQQVCGLYDKNLVPVSFCQLGTCQLLSIAPRTYISLHHVQIDVLVLLLRCWVLRVPKMSVVEVEVPMVKP